MSVHSGDVGDIKRRLIGLTNDIDKVMMALLEIRDWFADGDLLADAYMDFRTDFFTATSSSPNHFIATRILECDENDLQLAGFYGRQLDLKEAQVKRANRSITERIREWYQKGISERAIEFIKHWIDVINNFLSSLEVTGIGSALRELKDCMRDAREWKVISGRD